jgi:hypothetical protein
MKLSSFSIHSIKSLLGVNQLSFWISPPNCVKRSVKMLKNQEKTSEQLFMRFALMGLMSLAVVVFMGKSYEQSLQAMDSSIYARIALDATANGIRPVLPMKSLVGGWNHVGFNDCPFPLLVLSGWFMRIVADWGGVHGANAWSARFLPSLFAVGCIPLTFWIGALLNTPVVALAASLVLTLSIPFISIGARFELDPAMIFFILLSFVAWIKRKPVWMGVFAGLGMWMKNPVAFLVFPSAFIELAFTQQMSWKEIRRLILGGLIALGFGMSVWLLTGVLGGWDLVKDYWYRQVFGTAVGGRGNTQSYDLLLFTEALKRRYWPWLPFLLASLGLIVKGKKWKQAAVALPLSSVLVVIVAISCMRFKLDHYYLPMYPFLALLTVDCIQPWVVRHQLGFMKSMMIIGMLLPTFLVAMPVELAPEMFPALSLFEAVIQSHGTCRDRVAYIDGNQPYGSFVDYDVEIGFYTNRPFLKAQCSEASMLIDQHAPEWVIVSGENRKNCIREEQRRRYPTTYRFGNQYLLSRQEGSQEFQKLSGNHSEDLSSTEIDLTFLARKLSAPLDCTAVPLPKNRYYRYE